MQQLHQTTSSVRRASFVLQAYRHYAQQHIVRQVLSRGKAPEWEPPSQGMGWEVGGMAALIAAAALCGLLAQVHLG